MRETSGLSQNLEVAIEAARLLGNDFQLLLLGDGTRRAELERLADGLPGGSVCFRAAVAPARAMEIMRASDALLVSLADVAELGRSIPVKLYDSCAVARPVIVAAPGELRRTAERAGAALTIDPGDAPALATAVRSLRDDHELSRRLIKGGTAFAEAHLRDRGVEQLELLLRSVVERPANGRRR